MLFEISCLISDFLIPNNLLNCWNYQQSVYNLIEVY